MTPFNDLKYPAVIVRRFAIAHVDRLSEWVERVLNRRWVYDKWERYEQLEGLELRGSQGTFRELLNSQVHFYRDLVPIGDITGFRTSLGTVPIVRAAIPRGEVEMEATCRCAAEVMAVTVSGQPTVVEVVDAVTKPQAKVVVARYLEPDHRLLDFEA